MKLLRSKRTRKGSALDALSQALETRAEKRGRELQRASIKEASKMARTVGVVSIVCVIFAVGFFFLTGQRIIQPSSAHAVIDAASGERDTIAWEVDFIRSKQFPYPGLKTRQSVICGYELRRSEKRFQAACYGLADARLRLVYEKGNKIIQLANNQPQEVVRGLPDLPSIYYPRAEDLSKLAPQLISKGVLVRDGPGYLLAFKPSKEMVAGLLELSIWRQYFQDIDFQDIRSGRFRPVFARAAFTGRANIKLAYMLMRIQLKNGALYDIWVGIRR